MPKPGSNGAGEGAEEEDGLVMVHGRAQKLLLALAVAFAPLLD